jgi:hypothetical protein
VSPYAKQKLSAPNPKLLLLPNRSSRNRDAGDKGAQCRPFPPPPKSPLSRPTSAPTNFQIFLRNQHLVSVAWLRILSLLIFLNFLLTIPITSYTITSPASLRSDHLIGINRNADRLRAGTLIDFPWNRHYRCDAVVLKTLVRRCPQLQRPLRRYGQQLTMQTELIEECNALHDTKERLARWLLMRHDRAPSDILPLTQE